MTNTDTATSAETDLTAAARVFALDIGLRYVDCSGRGIQREMRDGDPVYTDQDGDRITDPAVLQRIRSLGIPPAWTHVWICTNQRGHIQATGRDARGRKQYRYHEAWRASRDATKFHRLIAFGAGLGALRDRVDKDMRRPTLDRDRIVAAVVRLLDRTHVRVGNEEYARLNGSFGLTTLRTDHVDVSGDRLRLRFRGKSGKEHRISVADRRIARVVARCEELPGQTLFQYVGDDGEVRPVRSEDVNEYLGDFTAKDFRTWAGTVGAVRILTAADPPGDTPRARQREVRAMLEEVAADLGNTVAVCKKSYVHPEVMREYVEEGALRIPVRRRVPPGLLPEEADLLAWLRGHERAALKSARRSA